MTGQMVLFGGTFDPVHYGHLIAARAVAERFGFERITLVPASTPPHKPGPRASGQHRLAMLELAIADDPLFDLCRLELDRAGPSYTFDTLTSLAAQSERKVEFYWIVGADMLEILPTWHRAEEVLAMATVVVAARPPWQARIPQILTELRKSLGDTQVERIKAFVAETPLVDISSTDLRRRVSDGLAIRYLTPDSVIAYIRENGLYRHR